MDNVQGGTDDGATGTDVRTDDDGGEGEKKIAIGVINEKPSVHYKYPTDSRPAGVVAAGNAGAGPARSAVESYGES